MRGVGRGVEGVGWGGGAKERALGWGVRQLYPLLKICFDEGMKNSTMGATASSCGREEPPKS